MTTIGYNPTNAGCTAPGCGTQDTETVDGVHGRRCAQHPPGYSRQHLEHVAKDGLNVRAYLRTVVAHNLRRDGAA